MAIPLEGRLCFFGKKAGAFGGKSRGKKEAFGVKNGAKFWVQFGLKTWEIAKKLSNLHNLKPRLYVKLHKKITQIVFEIHIVYKKLKFR